MIIQIDTQKIKDANEFGEVLRNYCFMPDRYGDYGCYSTFKLKPEFIPVPKDSTLGRKLIKLLLGSASDWNEDEGFYQDLFERSELFTNGNIHLGWFWNGDGTLLFVEDDKIAINDDCKKDYRWDWLNEKGEIL